MDLSELNSRRTTPKNISRNFYHFRIIITNYITNYYYDIAYAAAWEILNELENREVELYHVLQIRVGEIY